VSIVVIMVAVAIVVIMVAVAAVVTVVEVLFKAYSMILFSSVPFSCIQSMDFLKRSKSLGKLMKGRHFKK